MDKNKPELLSPAGSFESIIAAVNSGCDAVYFGAKKFSARSYATNLSYEEMNKVVEICKPRDVKTYVAMNTMIKESEFKELDQCIRQIYKLGIDAIIVQDLGIINFLRQNYGDLPIHGSTQMTIHSLEGVKIASELGLERIVLSRELSLMEIKDIVNKSNIEVECFIHGALCYSYSGQCLMSSYIGGRSGNRGNCAQPCRLPYKSLMNNNHENNLKDKYILSCKDVSTLEILPQLIESGIHSFKIEGRMKRPEYVAGVTTIYRKYIDMYYDRGYTNYKVDKNDISMLKQLFNRGEFCSGYYINKKDMISTEKPKNWGVKIGKITRVNKKNNTCIIKLIQDVNPGDGIEIWTVKEPHPGCQITKQKKVNETLEIKINGAVNVGDYVYRTKDKKLLDDLKKKTNNIEKKIDIAAFLKIKKSQPLSLTLQYKNDRITKDGMVVEKAENRPLQKERIIKQISKTGGTSFHISNLTYEVDEDIFIPISSLNELRRNALEELESIIHKDISREIPDIVQPNKKHTHEKSFHKENKEISVLLNRPNQLTEEIIKRVNRLYIEFINFDKEDINEAIKICSKHNTKLFLALPHIMRKNSRLMNSTNIKNIDQLEFAGYLIRTYGQVLLIKDSLKEKIYDYTFNIANNEAVSLMNKYNPKFITISSELSMKDINEFKKNHALEAIVYGHIQLMVTEQCIIKEVLGCKQGKNSNNLYKIKDRKDEKFLIENNCEDCYSMIYNSKPIFIPEGFNKLHRLPLSSYRLQFVHEDSSFIQEVLGYYLNLLDVNQNEKYNHTKIINMIKNLGYTKGHFYRGV